ncbi:MAG: CDP-alcohol phosphatidyltransferase family protein [Oscillospiraceae bacterium]|nr:CDP-alcohol phosphatidyltransferase family protein [Oscillospiraceae bacterium]
MNLPNLLSLLRLCMVPVFVLMFFSKVEGSDYIALAVFVVATATDMLDGMIARRQNKITNLGKVLDPLGDKLMALSVLTCLTIDRRIPLWAVIVLLTKEVIMGIGGFFIYRKSSFMPPSNYFGKTSTVILFIACVLLIAFKDLAAPWPTVIISIAIAVAVVAFLNYLIVFIKLLRKIRNSEDLAPANDDSE